MCLLKLQATCISEALLIQDAIVTFTHPSKCIFNDHTGVVIAEIIIGGMIGSEWGHNRTMKVHSSWVVSRRISSNRHCLSECRLWVLSLTCFSTSTRYLYIIHKGTLQLFRKLHKHKGGLFGKLQNYSQAKLKFHRADSGRRRVWSIVSTDLLQVQHHYFTYAGDTDDTIMSYSIILHRWHVWPCADGTRSHSVWFHSI